MRFKGKTALVTGAGGGIGLAIALRVASEGASVVLTDLKPAKEADLAPFKQSDFITADASSVEAMQALIKHVTGRYGRLDAVLCAAGALSIATLEDMDTAKWSAALNANLNTAVVTIRAALPALKEAGGSICIISSLAGLFAATEACGYVTTKHALIGLTKSVARDYGQHSVRCNVICPGWVRTPMANAEMAELKALKNLSSTEEAYALVVKDMPLQQVAEPEDIASAAAFLTSDDAKMITGAVLPVDGGATVVDVGTLAFD